MTGPNEGNDDGAVLGRLLTELADDPDAPPTSVSALSVIAAATSTHRSDVQGDSLPALRTSTEVDVAPSAVPAAEGASVGELHVLAAQRDADRRAKRRRTGVFAGLAAACVIGLAAIVVPLVTSSSGTTTSAGAARDNTAADAQAGGTAGGTAAAAAPAESAESADAGRIGQTDAGQTDAGQTAAGGPADAGQPGTEQPQAPAIDPSNPDANRPPPGESALTETVPVPGVGPQAGGGVGESCWPALPDAASAALVGALPAGSFGAPGLLGLGCPADPVAGASLNGTTPDTQLVVRVVPAAPGACAQSASETGAGCVARGGDQYVSNDSGNLSVYAYGNGYEVEVGGRPATGIAPIPSGLNADQLSAAAAAVLAALG